MKIKDLVSIFLLICSCLGVKASDYDVVVYGATSGGVTAAVQAARMGKQVVLISQDRHVGGMTASGLGATDINQREAIGGLSREFYQRIYAYYTAEGAWRNPEGWANYSRRLGKYFWRGKDDRLQMQWMFEPHVAEQVFQDMLLEAGVKVVFSERLDQRKGVEKKGNRIYRVVMESGQVYKGRMYIDATYEGDLMAGSGVSYFVGREGNEVYGETMNGILPGKYVHKSKVKIDPYRVEGDPASGLLPFVEAGVPGKKGEGDHRIQAYCYRFCLSCDPANQRPIERPERYEPMWYEHICRWVKANPGLSLEQILTLTPLPNDKTDVNHADFIGANYLWPEGSYQLRDSLAEMHRDYVLGLLWFLANDRRLPDHIRGQMRLWGLARDEFRDNFNFPHQIYVREARRLLGGYVMTEAEVTGKRIAPESVGLATYWFDSHVVSRYADEDGALRDEGTFWDRENIYPVSYRSICPKENECANLLVPVCLSASHAAYGSIRMEPVYMVLGQSAAVAAVLSIEKGKSIQQLSYPELRQALLSCRQIIEWNSEK